MYPDQEPSLAAAQPIHRRFWILSGEWCCFTAHRLRLFRRLFRTFPTHRLSFLISTSLARQPERVWHVFRAFRITRRTDSKFLPTDSFTMILDVCSISP